MDTQDIQSTEEKKKPSVFRKIINTIAADNFWYGVIIGLVAPVIGFSVFKFIKYDMFTLKEMYQWMTMNHNLITAYISVSLLANAVFFTLFVNAKIDKTAKGIFAITVLYAVIALAIKFFG
jgi:NADH:ubiquinone oxidoreductase subunit K